MAYDRTLGYDPDIKDYSALIANTTDPAVRAALLEQRQNKLDHLETIGKKNTDWADNATVATWTGTYQPGGWNEATASYNPVGGQNQEVTGLTAAAGKGADAAYDRYLGLVQEQYKASAREQDKALTAAVANGVAELRAQAESINQSYDDLARQAYISYMQGAKNLPYTLSVNGLNGGASESALVTLGTAYQENLGASERERLKALRQIDSEIAALRSTGDVERANAAASRAEQEAKTMASMYQRLLDAQLSEAQSIANQAYRQQQLSQNAEQEAYERRLMAAKLLADAGDFSGYRALGMDTTALENAYRIKEEQNALAGGTSKSAASRTSKNTAHTLASAGSKAKTKEEQEAAAELAEYVTAPYEPVDNATMTAARTYAQELMRLYSNDVDKAVLQVGKDLRSNFISRQLAQAALSVLTGGEGGKD